MKKMFVIAAMLVAATMVACCGEQNKAKEGEACCEQKTECCEQKAECQGECQGECQKAECEKKAEGECCGECQKAEAPAEEAAPAAEAAPEA